MQMVILLVLSLSLLEVHSVSNILRQTQPLYGLSTVVEEHTNNTCLEQLQLLRVAADEGKVWALKAMDASGRPGPGFIYGNNLWIGSHSQCKDISNTKPLEINNEKVEHLKTPYDYPPYPMEFAIVYIKHNSTLQLHIRHPSDWIIQLGLCIPKSCSANEILNLTETYTQERYLEIQQIYNLNMEVVRARKVIEDNLWFFKLPKTIAFSALFFIVLLLTIIGTIYDIKRKKLERKNLMNKNSSCVDETGNSATMDLASKTYSRDTLQQSTFGEILQCFSFTTNTKILLKTKLSLDSVSCIHGLKFITTIWILAGHATYFQIDYLTNKSMMYRLFEPFFAQPLSNSTYSVDTFFVISGFLLSYFYYKVNNPHEKSDDSINYLLKMREFAIVWINRFFRLTPLYVVVILFTNIIHTYYRETSPLTTTDRLDLLCDKYWWRNILYINNLFPVSEICMHWSWYLPVDMQLFTITLLLLILSTKSFKISASAVVVLILSSMVSTAWKAYAIGFIPTLDEVVATLDDLYIRPWNRMGPYLVGVITGYLLMIKMQNKLILAKKVKLFLWSIFFLSHIWILFALYTHQLSVEFYAFYTGTSRTLWGIGIAWVLIACCTGNAGSIQKLLSFKGFIPLSRLTYSAYLLNPVVANMIYLGGESTFQISSLDYVLTSGGVILTTFYMAYLFTVLVESPCILLTKIVLRKIGAKTSRD